MNIIRTLCFLTCLALFSTYGCSKDNFPPVEIMSSRFYIVNIDKDGKRTFSATQEVPLREDQHYGWILSLRTNKDVIHYTEQITLADATDWPQGDQYHVSADRRSVTVDKTKSSHTGVISGGWVIAAKDPPGMASIKILIEGKVEHHFDFELKKPE